MSFSAEMKDFLAAYKTGQQINASRTDQDYKEAQTTRTQKTTERENDPETLKTAAELERAKLDKIRDSMRTSATARGVAGTRQQLLQEQLRQLRQNAVPQGSGLLPPGGLTPTLSPAGTPAPAATGALPVGTSTMDTDEDLYADGGAVPTEDERERGTSMLRKRFEDNAPSQMGGKWWQERYVGHDMATDMDRATKIEDDLEADRLGRSREGNRRLSGGRRYADGGLVPDEDEEADGGGVLDTSPEPVMVQPANAPTDVSARSREPRVPKGLEGVISPALVADATKAGMTFLARESGLANPGAIRSPRTMAAARAIAQGMGGLSEQEMQAARQAVDPQGQLTESQRNMAALGSVYQFWANKGEPQKAEKVAAQMLQYYRNASQRYAAIAAKAAEGGNVDLATKAALKAYQNVPDGNDLEIIPNPDGGLMYAITGPDGNITMKGIATPQQLAASAMGLATGGFDKAILAAAGAREAPQEAVGGRGGKPQSATDRKTEAETIGAEIGNMKNAWIAKNKDAPVDEEMWNEVGNTAQHIYQQNPKATASEVARAAHALLIPGKDPEKPPFKVKPGEDGKPNVVDFGGRMKVNLDDDQLDAIMNARAARVKSAVDKINSDMEEADKPGFTDKAAGALDTAVGGVKKFADEGGVTGLAAKAAKNVGSGALSLLDRIYGQHIPQGTSLKDVLPEELVQRVGSDLNKIDELVRSKGREIEGRGAIPVDDNDRPL